MQTPASSPIPEEIEIVSWVKEEILKKDEEISSESSESSWSPRLSEDDDASAEEEEDFDERYEVPPAVAKQIVVEWMKIVEQSEPKLKKLVSRKDVEKQLAYAILDMFQIEH